MNMKRNEEKKQKTKTKKNKKKKKKKLSRGQFKLILFTLYKYVKWISHRKIIIFYYLDDIRKKD